jgi:hypothetical protein
MKIIYNVRKRLDSKYDYHEKVLLELFCLSYHLTQTNVSNNIFIYADNFYYNILTKLGYKNLIIKDKIKNEQTWTSKVNIILECLQIKEPFCFIDNDMLIWEPIEFGPDVTVYCQESDWCFNSILSYALNQYKAPYTKSYNTGIYGFKKITDELIKYYKMYTVDFFDKPNLHGFDMVSAEQIIFFHKALNDKVISSVTPLLNFCEQNSQKYKITHLLGSSKYNAELCLRVSNKLKKHQPDLWLQIQNIMK